MVVGLSHSAPGPFSYYHWLVIIFDVKTDKPLTWLEVDADYIAVLPDGSQIATINKREIKIMNVGTRSIDQQIILYNDIDETPGIVWSPNGQFLAFASKKQNRIGIYISSLTGTSGSAQFRTSLTIESSNRDIFGLTCSPDSSRVVAAIYDSWEKKMMLYIYCTWSGALIGTTSSESDIGGASVTPSFAANGEDILFCAYNPSCPRILYFTASV